MTASRKTEPGANAARGRDGIFPSLELEATAFTKPQLIRPLSPQLALAGRSNVGKSSLINALAGKRNLAKVSATPGKTRSVNYYRIGNTPSCLVDLPGYGYARCGRDEREKWAALTEHYLRNTPGLRGLILLLDARLPPQKPDAELLAFAVSLGLPVLPVLTKTDKCSKRELAASTRAWRALLDGEPIGTSSRTRDGIASLWTAILEYTA